MPPVLSVLLIATGALTWLIGGNVLLWRHCTTKRAFGRRWPVRVDWGALSTREWLQLLALAVAALAVMAIGLFTLPE